MEFHERRRLNKIARNLKFVREYRGFTQSELSKNIPGLSQSNLSKFEKGMSTIGDEKLKEIMKFLNWPFAFLEKANLGRLRIVHSKGHCRAIQD